MTFEQIAEKYWNEFGSQFDTTPEDACRGLIRESLELEQEMIDGSGAINKLHEASDVIFYLLYILRRDGFTLDDMIRGMESKLEICKARKWKKNGDGTYSHIKE